MNRAFYGIMNSKLLMTSDGVYTNAIFGFLSILNKLIEDENPDSELSYDTIGFYCEEIMKRAIPKPNPNYVRMWLEHSTKLKDLLYEENDKGYRQLKGFGTVKELIETLQKLPQDCEIWTNLAEDGVVKAPVNILYQVEDNSFRFL